MKTNAKTIEPNKGAGTLAQSDAETKQVYQSSVLAVIDIGSNAIRMMIAQLSPDGGIEVLDRLSQAARLGQDTFRLGRLTGTSMRSAVAILRDYRKVIDSYRADHTSVVATSAVREASNTDTFVERVFMATGLDVSVITVPEESRLTVSAVREAAGEEITASKRVLIAEVGGGSTIVNVLKSGVIVASQGLPIGAVRLQEVLATSTEPADQAAKLIEHQVRSAVFAFKNLVPLKGIETFIAVGGDMRWAAQIIGRKGPQPNLWSVSRRALEHLTQKLQHSTADELARTHRLELTQAETLVPSLLIYDILLGATSAQEILVSDVSMRDGLLQDLARRLAGGHEESFRNEVLQSAVAIAEKYGADLVHANKVKELAVKLFNLLQPVHRLDAHHRLLLEVATILHEIGLFISSRAHHKHSYYLITHSDILGLTPDTQSIVAAVARYHRRSRPKPSHPEYTGLSRDKRIIINKLAAILRVADSLDISRTQQIQDFEHRLDKASLTVLVAGHVDLTLERRSLAAKSDMFEDIYGLRVSLEAAEQ
jgi:exopolyphosphatase/guanosine-5'-triphosphate,3'-diphosphate pyrophosphatase